MGKVLYKVQIIMLVFLYILLMATKGWAATYYEDATNGNDNNNGLSTTASWKTIAKVNKYKFEPGDQILFKRGEVWREQLIVSSSGAYANPITYSDYGSGVAPVISGANVLKGFSSTKSGVFTVSNLTVAPYVVIYNGIKLTANRGALSNVRLNQWDWNANTLYIGLSESPDNGILEAGQRTYSIDINAKNYVDINNISVTGATQGGIMLEKGSSYCNISNNIVANTGSQGFQAGIVVWGGTNNNISSNVVSAAYIGIYLTAWNGTTTSLNNVTNNIVSNCDGAGISVGVGASNNVVQKNDVSFNNLIFDDQGGLYTANCGAGNIFRYNKSYNNGTATTRSTGIQIDGTSGPTQVYYNLFWGNSNGGIALTSSGHSVYNNTAYHNNEYGYDVGEISIFASGYNMTFKNNIVIPSIGKHIIRINEGSTIGHHFDYNCYLQTTESMFGWSGKDYTFSGWKIVNGGNDLNSKSADPSFVDPAGGNFRLTASSPCKKAGTNLGNPYNFGLDPTSTSWPFGLLDQNISSITWDMGAFVYPDLSPQNKLSPPVNLR